MLKRRLIPKLQMKATRSDIGRRMERALKDAFGQGCETVVIIGSDIPDITTMILQNAFDALNNHDLVLGPAADGGYYLIGMRVYHADIFANIAWSTSEVLSVTENRIQQHKLSLLALPLRKDLDTPDDYAVYRGRN